MANPIIRYPLDITGKNLDNFIDGEIHKLSNKLVRAIAPTYGAFFTDSLVIYDNRTQSLLKRGVHYLCTELLQTATQAYGKEICYLILIIDSSVSDEVFIKYQVLGGLYTRSADPILNIYETILKDERTVDWVNLINKPLEYTPGQHLHDGRDIYGLEYLATSLERVRNAIVTSDVTVYEGIMDWLTEEVKNIKKQNFLKDIAMVNEAILGVTNEKLMTPFLVKKVIKSTTSNRAKNYFCSILKEIYENRKTRK